MTDPASISAASRPTVNRTSYLGDGFIHVAFAKIYVYRGFTFEWHNYCGPMKCKANGDPSGAKAGKKFYAAAQEWWELPENEREKYRVY